MMFLKVYSSAILTFDLMFEYHQDCRLIVSQTNCFAKRYFLGDLMNQIESLSYQEGKEEA